LEKKGWREEMREENIGCPKSCRKNNTGLNRETLRITTYEG